MKAKENNQKVTGVIEEFLWHCEFEKKLSEKTLNAYKADLSQFVSSIGDLDISEVNYQKENSDNKGYAELLRI